MWVSYCGDKVRCGVLSLCVFVAIGVKTLGRENCGVPQEVLRHRWDHHWIHSVACGFNEGALFLALYQTPFFDVLSFPLGTFYGTLQPLNFPPTSAETLAIIEKYTKDPSPACSDSSTSRHSIEVNGLACLNVIVFFIDVVPAFILISLTCYPRDPKSPLDSGTLANGMDTVMLISPSTRCGSALDCPLQYLFFFSHRTFLLHRIHPVWTIAQDYENT